MMDQFIKNTTSLLFATTSRYEIHLLGDHLLWFHYKTCETVDETSVDDGGSM